MFALFLITIVASFLTGLLAPTQKAKRGNLKDFTFPQIGDGDPIAYLAGTVKITGPGLTWYGDYSTKAIKKSSGLFSKTTVGYKYYLGWQLVFCIGPNVTLRRLWFGTKSGDDEETAQENNPNFANPNDPKVPTPIYAGSFSTGTMHLADANAFGGDDGGGGYDLQIEFFGGEAQQGASAYLRSKINGFVPPYRGVCYLTAHGYIGNSTQLQNMTAELTRIPDPLNLGSKATVGAETDANPANVLYDIMTNNFGAGSCPVSRMDSQSFISGGLTLFDEDEAISIASGGSAQAMSAVVQDILRQIDATMYEDPETGLITLKLLREDYVVADLLVIDDSNIIGVSNYAINLWSDTKNRVRLKYEDRQKDYDDRIAVGEDMANVSFQGGQVKAIAVEHPYIKRKDHANRKTASELAVYSTPLARMSTTVQRISTTLRPGSVIKASYGKYKINQLILRVTKISYGDLINNHLTLELTGDKFAKTASIFAAPVTYFTKPSTGAISILSYVFDETPRFFNTLVPNTSADYERVMVYPFAPNDKQTGYNLWTKAAGEADFVETLDNADFADFFQSYAAIAVSGEFDIELQAVTNGAALGSWTLDQIKRQAMGLLQVDDEIIAYESFSLDPNTKRYTLHGVHRGLLDTVPAPHAARSLLAVLNVAAVGTREFSATDTVDVRMGSIAATGPQGVDQATGAVLALTNRPARPMAPVSITLDGAVRPASVDNTNGVMVTWKRRSRIAPQITFRTEDDEVPEEGTEYFVRYGAGNTFKEVSLGTGTSGTFTFDLQGMNTVEFFSRIGGANGLKSFQSYTFSVNVLHAAGVNASVSLSTATVNGVIGASVRITNGVNLQTAFTSILTASPHVPIDAMATASLKTANVTSNISAKASVIGGGGGTVAPLDDGYSFNLEDGNGNPLEG